MVEFSCKEYGIKPVKGHYRDAGIDLRTPEAVTIAAGKSVTIDTGVMVNIPVGYWGKLESKSGLNVKHDIVSLGGTIDSGYEGTIHVKLYNLGDKEYSFGKGDKIVQLVIMPCIIDELKGVEIQNSDGRGNNGFGSTGK